VNSKLFFYKGRFAIKIGIFNGLKEGKEKTRKKIFYKAFFGGVKSDIFFNMIFYKKSEIG